METDKFSKIGHTHKDCQDYAIAGNDYVILCDGCSTAIDSDVGARLLARAARLYLTNDFHQNAFSESVLATAKLYCIMMGYPAETLSATLLSVFKKNNNFVVRCIGDGYVFARRKNGTFVWKEIKYPSGAPYYLRYELDKSVKEEYISRFGQTNVITCYDKDNPVECYEHSSIPDNGGCHSFAFSCVDYDLVGVASDGVSSFVQLLNSGTGVTTVAIPPEKIIEEMLKFKNFNGEFVRRRMTKAFETFAELGWQNNDDFTVAAMYDKGN